MIFEMAKQLRDAGFPMPNGITVRRVSDNTYDYGPTLSELIAAFGSDFGQLRRETSPLGVEGWRASISNNRMTVFGTSPEDVLALLWLSLHPSTFSAEEA